MHRTRRSGRGPRVGAAGGATLYTLTPAGLPAEVEELSAELRLPGPRRRAHRPPPARRPEANGEQVSEVVKRITWEAGPINPGEFAEFEVSAGRVPEDADQLVFRAT